jgi:hypothetical protein
LDQGVFLTHGVGLLPFKSNDCDANCGAIISALEEIGGTLQKNNDGGAGD